MWVGRSAWYTCTAGAPGSRRVLSAEAPWQTWPVRQVGQTSASAGVMRPRKTSGASGYTFHMHHHLRVKSVYVAADWLAGESVCWVFEVSWGPPPAWRMCRGACWPGML